MTPKDFNKLTEFFFETGELKRIKRSGWWQLKIKEPESVAEHSFRTAIIAYFISKLENNPNPEKISFLALIHDLSESRLLDLHHVSSSYIREKKSIEEKIRSDQEKSIGFAVPRAAKSEQIIIKDADLLEMAFTAKEYLEDGHLQAKILLDAAGKSIVTKSAKRLYLVLSKSNSTNWWKKFSK